MTERSFVTDDDVRLVYDDLGPRDGVPIVLCHGLTMEGAQFRDTAAAFVAKGYRVLTPDLRGHARSGVPTVVSRETFTLERFGADQLAMLADAGLDQVHWVGNSLGGIVGLSLLPAGRFLSLTTYGTSYRIGLNGWFAEFWVGLSYWWLRPRVIAAMMSWLVSRHAPTRRYVAERIVATRPDVIAAIAGVVAGYDLRPLVEATETPMLLIDCREDWLVGWTMRSTLQAARRLGVKVAMLKDGGHCADLDAPAAWQEAVLGFVEDSRG
jgi:pimeloyl-ACP methyl ester carboxylesterase